MSSRRRCCGFHRELFRLSWKRKSQAHARKPRLSPETISLIKEMAANNRLWGAERIRGELLKLGLRVSKRTIQTYMRQVRPAKPRGQNWKAFLHTPAEQIWACDFLPVTDLFFRSLFAFFIIERHSRTVIHIGVTRSPTDAWTAQQLREATAYGVGPKYLIRDHDGKFGVGFARIAKMSHIEMLTIPYHAPRANAICERFLGSVRRECLDHLLILQEKQLHRVLNAYIHSFWNGFSSEHPITLKMAVIVHSPGARIVPLKSTFAHSHTRWLKTVSKWRNTNLRSNGRNSMPSDVLWYRAVLSARTQIGTTRV